MKLSRFRPAFFAFLCSAGFLHADIVVLKDGKRMEGNITAETPTTVSMRYKLTAKIWDNKDIPRTDIAEIIKQKPEEVELLELKKSWPTPDMMSAEKYEGLIQDRLRPFVNRYPGTPQAAEVEKYIAEAQAEKEKVIAGGVKVNGVWYSPQKAKAQSYNLKAYALLATMREKAAAKDWVGALQEFDKIAPAPTNAYSSYGNAAPTGYVASESYPKAVTEAMAVLDSFEGQIDQMIKDQPALQKIREDNFKKLVEPDLSRTRTAIEKEMQHWRTTMDEERRSSRWFTPYKYDMTSLKTLSATITAEKARLKQVDVAKLAEVNKAVSDLMTADSEAATSKDALKAMGDAIISGEKAAATLDQGTMASFLTIFRGYRERYAAYQAAQAAASAQPAAPAAAVPGAPGAAAPAGAPAVDARVAAALAAAGGGAAAAPQAQPGAAAPAGQAPAGMPQQQPQGYPAQQQPQGYPAQQPQGYPAQQPQGYPAQQPQAGYPAAQQPMAPVAPPIVAAEEPAEGFLTTNMMLIIGVAVLALVLVVAMLGKKKKKEA